MIVFEVLGVPAPKGSWRAVMNKGLKRPIMKSDNAKTKPWAHDVAQAADLARGPAEAIEGPVFLELWFFLPAPSSRSLRSRALPHTKPDIDKLQRTILDALKVARIYVDDGQVTDVVVRKRYVGRAGDKPGGMARVTIIVRPAEGIEECPVVESP